MNTQMQIIILYDCIEVRVTSKARQSHFSSSLYYLTAYKQKTKTVTKIFPSYAYLFRWHLRLRGACQSPASIPPLALTQLCVCVCVEHVKLFVYNLHPFAGPAK